MTTPRTVPFRIVADLDGCLVDWNNAMWRELVRAGAPMRSIGHDPTVWNWMPEYGAGPSHLDAVKGLQRQPAWWEALDPHYDFANASAQLRWLHTHHEVTFLSSRPEGVRQATVAWLRSRLNISNPHVVIALGDKVGALQTICPHFVFDDRLVTLVEFAATEVGQQATLFLPDRAYNRQTGVLPANIHRVESVSVALAHMMVDQRGDQ